MKNNKKPKQNLNLRIGLLLLIVLFSISASQAAVYTVTNTNDSGADSLRQAILDANSTADNDTINFDASLAGQTITLTSGELTIFNNGTLTINGLGADKLTVSGNNASRVFFIQFKANATINGITITDGNISGGGGGIVNRGTLTLTNSTVSNNSAHEGGGISNAGTLILTNSTVSNNLGNFQGGGIYNNVGGTLSATNSTVSGNLGNLTGGIGNDGTLTLSNSTVSNNTGVIIGGILTSYVTIGVSVDNSIIAGNIGGGYPSYASDVYGLFSSLGYNLIGNGDDSSGFTATGDQVGSIAAPIDPLLLPLDDYGGPTKTHALAPDSPAIDAGNSTLTTDQRGFLRPVDQPSIVNVGNGSDIGAFEVQLMVGPPTDKEQCRDGGWILFSDPSFRNQGQCIRYVESRMP